jgi:hypothetical protein
MTYTPGFQPMTTNDDPLARRALFVAFEGLGVLDLIQGAAHGIGLCRRIYVGMWLGRDGRVPGITVIADSMTKSETVANANLSVWQTLFLQQQASGFAGCRSKLSMPSPEP